MKNTIKYFKLELSVISLLFLSCIFVLAQTVGDINSSVGNARLMQHNMNEPHIINPAKDNNQRYEKYDQRIKNEHPEKNLSNHYTTKRFTGSDNTEKPKTK